MRRRRLLEALIVFALFIAIWWGYVVAARVPAYLVPAPSALVSKGWFLFIDAHLASQAWVTTEEILIGFVYGALAGLLTGQVFGRLPVLERVFTPLIVLTQTAPKISLAPLLVLWLGLGLAPKVALVALVVFFPIMTNTLIGVRSIGRDVEALLRLVRATAWQRFRLVELPHSLPPILAGVRIATTQAVTAAVIGELIGAKAGLGYLLGLGQETADVGTVLVSVILLSLLGYVLYMIVALAERRLLTWHESQSSPAA